MGFGFKFLSKTTHICTLFCGVTILKSTQVCQSLSGTDIGAIPWAKKFLNKLEHLPSQNEELISIRVYQSCLESQLDIYLA